MSAVEDVFDYLETQAIAGGSTEWTLIRRRILDEPAHNQLVVITEDGGVEPEIGASDGIGDSAMEDPAVQILVRAGAWDSDLSLAKAQEIREALHGLRDVALGGSGSARYLRVRAQSDVIFAGFDPQGRPQHTTSYRLLRESAQ